MSTRKWNLVVWGATGYTGKLIATYLTKHKRPIQWAIAGRNAQKLEELRKELRSKYSPSTPEDAVCGILTGDIGDPKSLDAITQNSSVIISAAGPYAQVGLPIVRACVANKCDYVDVTGETAFVRDVIDQYHETAQRNGVLLIPLAGFDSVPSDIGTHYTVQRLRERYGKGAKVRRVKNYVVSRGTLSGGTMASSIGIEKNKERKNNLFLLGGSPHPDTLAEHADQITAEFDSSINKWVGPFQMSTINTRTVRRTNALFEESGARYGEKFVYNEKAIAKDETQAKIMARPQPSPEVLQQLVNAGKLPKPGEGPSEEQRAQNSFKMTFIGETEDGKTVRTYIAGMDAYEFTAMSAVETALCILEKGKERKKPVGVLTPAFALGDSLRDKLVVAGVQIGEEGASKL